MDTQISSIAHSTRVLVLQVCTWMQVPVDEVVEEDHLEDQATSEVRDLHLQLVERLSDL